MSVLQTQALSSQDRVRLTTPEEDTCEKGKKCLDLRRLQIAQWAPIWYHRELVEESPSSGLLED